MQFIKILLIRYCANESRYLCSLLFYLGVFLLVLGVIKELRFIYLNGLRAYSLKNYLMLLGIVTLFVWLLIPGVTIVFGIIGFITISASLLIEFFRARVGSGVSLSQYKKSVSSQFNRGLVLSVIIVGGILLIVLISFIFT